MKIGIVGLGLIGGSLGIDWRSRGHYIIGISRKVSTCEIALSKNIADKAGTDFKLLRDAEVVVVCTPIGAIAATIKQITPHLNPETIITDVGSVKYPIVASCNPLWQNFIGGHPMAGTAESGIDAAIPNLFTGAAYVFTPTKQNKPETVEKLKAIALELNAIPYICDAQVHDRAVSLISHLPVMASAALIQACLKSQSDSLKLAQILASSGFRDTSRVGGGNPELGVMMAQYNQQELLRSLHSYRDNLDAIINLIEEQKWQDLSQILKENGEARSKFLN
ncbi:MAG: prephenate/arogenate dehydrogenase [Cyanobacteria bacterium P01_G01_bin.39]